MNPFQLVVQLLGFTSISQVLLNNNKFVGCHYYVIFELYNDNYKEED